MQTCDSETVIEFRCPNEPYRNEDTQCRRDLFGPTRETVALHDFSVGPYVEFRLCPRCRILWKVIIIGPNGPASMEAIDDRVETVSPEDVFGMVKISGSYPKKLKGKR